jgi:hypothetical protein
MISMYPLVSHCVRESLMSNAAEMLGNAVANAVLIMDVAVQMTTILTKIILRLLSVTSIMDIGEDTDSLFQDYRSYKRSYLNV